MEFNFLPFSTLFGYFLVNLKLLFCRQKVKRIIGMEILKLNFLKFKIVIYYKITSTL